MRDGLVFMMCAVLGGCAGDDASDPDPTLGAMPTGETADFIEPRRYVGLWYEMASIPMGFQESCFNTTARYEPIDDVTISVHNECNWGRADASPPLSIDGKATVIDTATNAKLVVDFGFNQGSYWIVDVGEAAPDEPYPWAAVSNDNRDSLWILARTPSIPEARYQAIYARLDGRGFEPARMRRTEHTR